MFHLFSKNSPVDAVIYFKVKRQRSDERKQRTGKQGALGVPNRRSIFKPPLPNKQKATFVDLRAAYQPHGTGATPAGVTPQTTYDRNKGKQESQSPTRRRVPARWGLAARCPLLQGKLREACSARGKGSECGPVTGRPS